MSYLVRTAVLIITAAYAKPEQLTRFTSAPEGV